MAVELDQPIELLPMLRERIWGSNDLSPYYAGQPADQRIGEIWYSFGENETALGMSLNKLVTEHPEILGHAGDSSLPGVCPLLLKMLFTTERLSVQVHPNDEYARKHHDSLGKTEAWYVVDAQPDAEVAIGFKRELTAEQFRESAQSGEIEDLLDWRQVQSGDIIFTPAGTVHAIGAGLTVCEIQQSSDITYRLYDYGRPRELHLDHGAQVSHLGPHLHTPEVKKLAAWRDQMLESEYFRIERLKISKAVSIGDALPVYALLICLKGSGTIGSDTFGPGSCFLVPANGKRCEINGGSEWILTYRLDHPLDCLSGQ
jgi:mannose-6-phosphate isomerase